MRHLAASVAALTLPVIMTPFVAPEQSNFSGTWIVTMPPILGIAVSVQLDGTETRTAMPTPGGPIQVSAVMSWVGRQLVIDET